MEMEMVTLGLKCYLLSSNSPDLGIICPLAQTESQNASESLSDAGSRPAGEPVNHRVEFYGQGEHVPWPFKVPLCK